MLLSCHKCYVVNHMYKIMNAIATALKSLIALLSFRTQILVWHIVCQKWWVGCSPPFIWRSFGKIEKYYWGQWGLLRLRAKWSVYWSAHFRQWIWSVCVLRWFTSFICLLKCSVSFMPPPYFRYAFQPIGVLRVWILGCTQHNRIIVCYDDWWFLQHVWVCTPEEDYPYHRHGTEFRKH